MPNQGHNPHRPQSKRPQPSKLLLGLLFKANKKPRSR